MTGNFIASAVMAPLLAAPIAAFADSAPLQAQGGVLHHQHALVHKRVQRPSAFSSMQSTTA